MPQKSFYLLENTPQTKDCVGSCSFWKEALDNLHMEVQCKTKSN